MASTSSARDRDAFEVDVVQLARLVEARRGLDRDARRLGRHGEQRQAVARSGDADDHVGHAGVGDERLAAGELDIPCRPAVALQLHFGRIPARVGLEQRDRAFRLRRWRAAADTSTCALASAMSVAAQTVPRNGPGKQARPISSATTARSTRPRPRPPALRSGGCRASLGRPPRDHSSASKRRVGGHQLAHALGRALRGRTGRGPTFATASAVWRDRIPW